MPRESDEKKIYEIEAYTLNDPADTPAWVFLTPGVVALYGICPFLALKETPDETAQLRRNWLQERADGGQAYQAAFEKLVAPEYTSLLVAATEGSRNELTQCLNRVFENDPSLGQLNHLMEVITSYKQSQNRSKKVKVAWERTMEEIHRIQQATGFDMLLYYDLLTKAKISKSALAQLSAEKEKDKETKLRAAIHKVLNCDKVLKQHFENVRILHTKATDSLYDLICADFVIAQEGRYFKRWYYLTTEEKNERLDSFCEHYLGTIVDAPDRARFLAKLQEFVKQALANKDLKISEVKWNTKAGKIDTIQRVNFDGDEFFLDEVDEEVKRTRRTKNEVATTKKNLISENIDSARLNRVLLKQILSCASHRKDLLIDHVLWKCCHCTTPQVRACTREHLVASYAVICAAINDAPPPTPRTHHM